MDANGLSDKVILDIVKPLASKVGQATTVVVVASSKCFYQIDLFIKPLVTPLALLPFQIRSCLRC